MRSGPDIAAWIDRHAAFTPTKPALITDKVIVTYARLAARINQLAVYFSKEQGLPTGARVAWLGHNGPDLIAALFACARAGFMFLPLNWRLSGAELRFIVADAGASLVVVDASCRERMDDMGEGYPLATLGFDAVAVARLPPPRACARLPVGQNAEAPLLLVYTSGTTGRPKGAVLTQRALLFNALNAIHMHAMTAKDVVLTVLPMFHVGGLNIQTTPALYCGATVALEPRCDAEETIEAIKRVKPSLTVQVPATLKALLDHPHFARVDLSCLRGVTTGSMDVPVALIEAMHARKVPVSQIYGATETGPVAIYQRLDDAFDSIGSIGRAGLHTEIRLVGADGGTVGVGTPGEILVRGPHVATGYWNPNVAAAIPFTDGWFASGDIAECDDAGLYWFKDRIKHVIISGGENIYPAELERILNASGDLREAAVVGRPHARWGEVPVVVAVKARFDTRKDEVLSLFNGTLARYKRPHDVVFIDALPRNALGKIEVQQLRELVGNV
ncbi:MAG: AMP-binding protein [Proteobacteria bacterium]|nr:AMP-binding protein [Pseudomonadota bacterium]